MPQDGRGIVWASRRRLAKAHCLAQGRRKPIQDGGLAQKLADIVRLLGQHLLGEVVDHVAVAPAKGGCKLGHVLSGSAPRRQRPLDGQGRQLQSRDPALGPGLKGADDLGVEFEPEYLVEKSRSLLGCETEVLLAKLDHLVTHPQAGQRQWGILAGDHDQMHLWRLVREQECHRIMDPCRVDEVNIVQHQDKWLGRGGNVVDQGCHHRLDQGDLRGPQQAQDITAQGPLHLLQGSDEVLHKAHRVVVAFVQGEPGDSPRTMTDPLAEQRRLAKAGRSRDEGQFAGKAPGALPETRIQGIDQPLARHQPRARWRDIEFGGQ